MVSIRKQALECRNNRYMQGIFHNTETTFSDMQGTFHNNTDRKFSDKEQCNLTETCQMSGAMYIQYVVFQDITNNNAMMQCINFKILQHSLVLECHTNNGKYAYSANTTGN